MMTWQCLFGRCLVALAGMHSRIPVTSLAVGGRRRAEPSGSIWRVTRECETGRRRCRQREQPAPPGPHRSDTTPDGAETIRAERKPGEPVVRVPTLLHALSENSTAVGGALRMMGWPGA